MGKWKMPNEEQAATRDLDDEKKILLQAMRYECDRLQDKSLTETGHVAARKFVLDVYFMLRKEAQNRSP